MMKFVGMHTEESAQTLLCIDEFNAQRMLGWRTFDVVMTHLVPGQITGVDAVQQRLLDAGALGCCKQVMAQCWRGKVMPEFCRFGAGSLRKVESEGCQFAHDFSSLALASTACWAASACNCL